jgi:RNA 3'-terminal phosphate cyclase (ATP)
MSRQKMRIVNIRSKRKKPGLRPQHSTAVEAAAAICSADVEGNKIGSRELVFHPKKIKAGSYRFDIGSAGSTSLVLQTLILPLSLGEETSTVSISGGTHVPWSPCYHYLDFNYLPFLWKIGIDLHLRMERAGFYPVGGGQIRATINPSKKITPFISLDRGRLLEIRGVSAVAKLSKNIASRQRRQVIGRLGRRFPLNDIRVSEIPAKSPGSLLLLLAEFEKSQVCYFALGAKGKSADKVADAAITEFEEFIATEGVIDQYLADQLLLPLAFANGISEFRVSKVTLHLVTNAEVIRKFLPVEIDIEGKIGKPGIIKIVPKP